MAESYICLQCALKPAQFACRCVERPVLLCLECIPAHQSKQPDLSHTTSEIKPEDLELVKQGEYDDRMQKIKDKNESNLESFRQNLEEKADNFVNQRIEKIDAMVNEITARAEALKEHIAQQKLEALEQFDQFVNSLMSSHNSDYDYLLEGDGKLEFLEIAPVKFVGQSPMESELFEIREEITFHIKEAKKAVQVFDTKNAQQFFEFEDEDRTATLKKGQIRGALKTWASVRPVFKSSSEDYQSLKFKFSSHAYFGICSDEQPRGIPGFHDVNGLSWNTSGLGNMVERDVELWYDGKSRKLTISCKGKVHTHQDANWPEEVYFVFCLEDVGSQISLLSN